MDNLETTESVEPTEVSEVTEEPQEAVEPSRPDGWDQIDFATATPEQIEKRFGRMFKQVKETQRTVSEYRTLAEQQSAVINELRQSQGHIVNHLQQDDFSRAEHLITQKQQDAYEKGDLAAFNKATTDLTKLELKREEAARQQRVAPQVSQPPVSSMDVINEAIQLGEITHDDADVFRSWANETDPHGNQKRGWINKADMRNTAAATEGYAVFNNPQYAHLSFAQKLAEIDRRMGVTNKNPTQSVLPSNGNLTRQPKTTTIKLDPRIEKVALRSKFAGPGKSDAEHIEAYKKQILDTRKSR